MFGVLLEPGETQRRTALERPRLLGTRERERLPERLLGGALVGDLEQQLAPKPQRLRLAPPLAVSGATASASSRSEGPRRLVPPGAAHRRAASTCRGRPSRCCWHARCSTPLRALRRRARPRRPPPTTSLAPPRPRLGTARSPARRLWRAPLRPFAGGPPLSGELQAQGVEEERVDKAERMPQRARPRQPLGGGRGGRAGVRRGTTAPPRAPTARRRPGPPGRRGGGAHAAPDRSGGRSPRSFSRALEPSEEEQRPANQTVRDDDRVVVLLLGELQERLPSSSAASCRPA